MMAFLLTTGLSEKALETLAGAGVDVVVKGGAEVIRRALEDLPEEEGGYAMLRLDRPPHAFLELAGRPVPPCVTVEIDCDQLGINPEKLVIAAREEGLEVSFQGIRAMFRMLQGRVRSEASDGPSERSDGAEKLLTPSRTF
jgi:hypothetical protein